MNITHLKSNTIPDFTGTVTVFDAAGLTQTRNASDLVRPSDWNSAHAMLMTLLGNTNNASTASGTNLAFSGGPNITLIGSGSRVGISAAAQSIQTQSNVQGISAGTQVGRTGDVAFVNSNGISFGMSGSSQVTASYTVPSQTGLVPYTGASTEVNLGTNWLSQVRGVHFEVGDIPTTPTEGQVCYDLKNLCLAVAMYGGAKLQIGQELYIIVYNDSGSDITDGHVVYQNGSARIEYVSGKFGDYPTVRLAQANAVGTSNAIGVSTTLIPNGGFGFVTAFGLVNNLNTSAWSDGVQLYLSADVAGDMTSTPPTTPNRSVLVARVIRAHATAGNIMLGLQQFANLADHLDVSIASPSEGDVLQYDGAMSKWENIALPAVSAINISAGTTSNNASAFVFSNSHNVNFGLNGSTITASAVQSVQTQSNVQGLSAGTQVGRTGDIVFANSNGMSFGMSGSSQITGSYTVPSTAGLLSAVNLSAGTTSQNLSAVTFSNGNGVSFGLNGSVVTASVAAAGGAQTGISGLANSETTYTSGSVTFSALGAITIRSTTGQQFQFSVNSQSVQPVAASAANGSYAFSTLSFSNANGMSFGTSAGSAITGSYTVPTVTNSSLSVSDAATSGTLARLAFTNLNGVTLSLSTGAGGSHTIVGSHNALTSQSNQAASAANGSFAFQTLSFSNLNGVSFGTSAGSAITASVAAQSVQPGIQSIAFANTTFTTGAVSFSNANGISFGSSGAQVTASYTVPSVPAQTAQTIGVYGSSQTYGQSSSSTVDARSLSFVGSGGISVGLSAGSVLISGQTTAAQTNQTAGLYAVSNTTQSSSGTADARSLSFAGAGIASVGVTGGTVVVSVPAGGGGITNINFSAGTTSQNLSQLVFSNSNNVSFGLNGSTVTASASQSIQTIGMYALGNTTQNSSSTFDARTLSLNGLGAMTVGYSNGSVQLSAPATSSLIGTSGISISTAGSTISIYRPAGSYFGNLQYVFNTQTQTVGQSTSVVFPFDLKEPESIGLMQFPHTISMASTSFASTANTSYSYDQRETHNLVLYSRGTGASSMSLLSVFSTSASVRMSIQFSRNTTNNISVTHGLTFPVSNGTSSLSFSYAATNSTDQISTTHMTALTGAKLWDTQFSTYLNPSVFWMVYGVSTTQTTEGTAGLSAARLLHSHFAMSMANNTVGRFGLANAASVQWRPGIGSFSTAGGGTISAFPISAVSSSASHNVPLMVFMNIA